MIGSLEKWSNNLRTNPFDTTYTIIELLVLTFGILTLLDNNHRAKYGATAFWIIYAITMMFGSILSDRTVGIMLVGLTLIAAAPKSRLLGIGSYKDPTADFKMSESKRLGNKLFAIALILPTVAFVFAKTTGESVLVGLAVAATLALLPALLLTRTAPQSVHPRRGAD